MPKHEARTFFNAKARKSEKEKGKLDLSGFLSFGLSCLDELRMSNMPDRNVQVILNSKHAPVAFEWQGRMRQVKEVQECWRLVGAWWDNDGERTFFRVLTDHNAIYELCFDHVRSAWALSGVQD